MVVNQYGVVLNNLGNIRDALKDIFLRRPQQASTTGVPSLEDECIFWINKAYVLLESYPWKWSRLKDPNGITTTDGTSAYRLSPRARDKQPIDALYNPTHYLEEWQGSFEAYQKEIYARTGEGTPRRFAYIEKYTTSRAYSTGTVSATVGTHAITGVGTSWLDNLCQGSTITIGANTYTVARVDSDLALTSIEAITATVAASAYTSASTHPLVQIDLDPIPDSAIAHTLYYFQRFQPLVNTADVPLLPPNDRWVLVDGAYSLYQWFHDEILKTGISPSASTREKDLFLTAPTTAQKFFNQYVSKLIADDRAMVGAARPQMILKRGY